MKLMVVGSDKIYSIENFYVKYLREAGVEINHFPAQRFFYDYYQKGIFQKLIYRVGISWILKQINEQFKQEVKRFKPEVIWVFKGMEIFPESLQWAKESGIKLVNFNADSPFLFSGKGSGNANVSNGLGLYDLHLTYHSGVKKEMEKRFNIPVAILPFGYDIDNDLYEKCCDQEEILKLCFLGNPDKYRGQFIESLASNDIAIDVFGNDWNKFVQHPSIKIHSPIYADECWMALRRYRVQLNMMRPHNPDSHNMRSFELGGVGAIQLAPDTTDHRNYFCAGTEIFIYTDLEDCLKQIKYILSMPKAAADEVRLAARNRSVQSGYFYQSRATQVLALIKGLIG